MRVIAGKARRLQLKTVPGKDTRPTTDRIKETLFNMLQNELLDVRFLDLFAGSGGIGIEALSRGASCAVFVEKSPRAAVCIEENLKITHLAGDARLMRTDVFTALTMLEGSQPFDMIFMDPPYGMELEKRVLTALSDSSLIHEDTLLIVEADLHTEFDYLEDLGYEMLKYKKYKTNAHVFVKKNNKSAI